MATAFKATDIADYKIEAERSLHPHAWVYYSTASGGMETYQDNRRVFERYRLRPRVLRGIVDVDISTSILGHRITSPFCIAPTALHVFAHPNAELETAKAASQYGTAMTLSSVSTAHMRTLSSTYPDGLFLKQTYILKNKNLMRLAMQEAEASGFKAIVLTVDSVVRPQHRTLPLKDSEFLMTLLSKEENQMVNYIFEEDEESYRAYKEGPLGLTKYMVRQGIRDTPMDIGVIRWVKSVVPNMKVIVKGILTGKAAREAVDNGADAVWVSNHGGRQLDSVPASLDVLSEVVDAVKGTQAEVYIDSGFRTGNDVFKALALGARAVFIGRPVLWGLSVNGADGVYDVLDILAKELRMCMTLCGCSSISDISQQFIQKECDYLNCSL